MRLSLEVYCKSVYLRDWFSVFFQLVLVGSKYCMPRLPSWMKELASLECCLSKVVLLLGKLVLEFCEVGMRIRKRNE